jgi:predicted HNH restriction endonuclease
MQPERETWRGFIERLVVDYCNEQGSRTFTTKEFWNVHEEIISRFSSSNKHPYQKLCEQLQFLRNDAVISFGERGSYTLRKPAFLQGEFSEEAIDIMLVEQSSKQEYIREAFARERGWVQQAKEAFGYDCLHPHCTNRFSKPDGFPYIEVHHIVPLCEGGEDALWNLAVVCAHHHKMAHFADTETRHDLQKTFQTIVESRL